MRLIESSTFSGSEALDIRCAGASCTSEVLPKRLLNSGIKLAPLGDQLLAVWTDASALRAAVGSAASIAPSSSRGAIVDGGQEANVQKILVRGDDALVVFSVRADMYAIALSAGGRVRAVTASAGK